MTSYIRKLARNWKTLNMTDMWPSMFKIRWWQAMAHKKEKINQKCSCNVATTQEAYPPHNKNCKCLVMLLDWLLVVLESILCDNNILHWGVFSYIHVIIVCFMYIHGAKLKSPKFQPKEHFCVLRKHWCWNACVAWSVVWPLLHYDITIHKMLVLWVALIC